MNGMNETIRRIYFDTNVYISLVEHSSAISKQISRLFGGWEGQSHLIVTSEFTLAEALVKPIKIALDTGNYTLHDTYIDWIADEPDVRMVLPASRIILIRAALVRAQLSRLAQIKVKLPDAIHIASALQGNCDVFITGDKDLQAAVQAIAQRMGLKAGDPETSLWRVMSLDPDELAALAEELGCP